MPKAKPNHTRNPSKLEVIEGGGKHVLRRKPRAPQLTVIEGDVLEREALAALLSPDRLATTRLFIHHYFENLERSPEEDDAFMAEWRARMDRATQRAIEIRAALVKEAAR